MRARTTDAFAALLLSQLPNLECLQLGKNVTRQSRFVSMMLRSGLCEEPRDSCLSSFEHLQDVSAVYFDLGVDIRHYTDAWSTTDVLLFFYFPSVQCIATLIDNLATFAWPAARPPNAAQLASLDLKVTTESRPSALNCQGPSRLPLGLVLPPGSQRPFYHGYHRS